MKKVFCVLLAACMTAPVAAVPAISASAAASEIQSVGASVRSGDCVYTINGTTLTISGQGSTADYNCNMYSDEQNAFSEGIEHVIIEEGVTRIGEDMFCNCTTLKSVSFPSTLKEIGGYAFANCSALTEAIIPEGVRQVGYYAFYGCYELEKVSLPESLTQLGSDAFESTAITSIRLPSKLKVIEQEAFAGCENLTNVEIGSSVERIELNAFYQCTSLSDIHIPDNVKFIESGAFSGTPFINNLPQGAVYLGSTLYMYKGQPAGTYTVADGTTCIAGSAFYSKKNLYRINIPDSVTEIGTRAFYECKSLNTVVMSDNVEEIYDIFYKCSSLKNINLPSKLKRMTNYAFSQCTSLESIELPYGLEEMGLYVFSGCTSLKSITLPDSLIDGGGATFYGCSALESVKLSKNMKSVSQNLFAGCSNLTEIVIPEGIEAIKLKAFSSCKKLANITIPDSVYEIGYQAFGSNMLNYGGTPWYLNKPDGVVFAGNVLYQFKGVSVPETYVVPEGTKGIADSAFADSNITDISLPDSLVHIGQDAFVSCKNLKHIILPDTLKSIEYETFMSSGLESIDIPESVESIGSSAFKDCADLKSVTIPENVKEMGWNVFENCPNVTIYGTKGSYAEKYANENDIPFVAATLNYSRLSANEIILGQTVTVNAKSNEKNCTYAVLYKKRYDTKWTVKQNYSANDTIAIKPAKATLYDVCVKVKNSKGEIVKKFFEVQVNAKLVNTSTISATTIKKGNTVTLNGSATGGAGGYTYAALYKKKSETKWTTRQGYKDNSQILVRPYTNTDYDICIKVKDKNGTVAKKYFTVTVNK